MSEQPRLLPMRYALWNNKGGVGKTFLSFILSTEIARMNNGIVLVADMCPQANLSEIILGGNGIGSERLDQLIKERKTIGGYFDSRIKSPHGKTDHENEFLIKAHTYNPNLPKNLYLLAGDPSLELQSQVISQISGQLLPVESWMNVHSWLDDLISECESHLGVNTNVFVDCNPSFSAYTELAMVAVDSLIIPCSSDGSSARAIDNVGSLLYGISNGMDYGAANFPARMEHFKMELPTIHSVVLSRSTQYNNKASKAFGAMFDEIKRRTSALLEKMPDAFELDGPRFADVPDSHSVAVVCSHQGRPLYKLTPGRHNVHDTTPQVNDEPLDRYKEAVAKFISTLTLEN